MERFPGLINTMEHLLEQSKRSSTNIFRNEELKDLLRMTLHVRDTVNNHKKRTNLVRTATLNKSIGNTSLPTEQPSETNPFLETVYFEGYVMDNMTSLLSLKKDLFEAEEAFRYQPELLIDNKEFIEQNLKDIDQQLEIDLTETDEMLIQYYEALKNFIGDAKTLSANFSLNFENFVNQSKMVLNLCGNTDSQTPLSDLFETFYLFTKIYCKIIDQSFIREREAQHREKFKFSELEDSIEEENGIMDRIMSNIKTGTFSVSSD